MRVVGARQTIRRRRHRFRSDSPGGKKLPVRPAGRPDHESAGEDRRYALSIQDLADRLSESRRRERLGEEGGPFVENAAAHDDVLGISGDVQHVEARTLGAKDLHQLAARSYPA